MARRRWLLAVAMAGFAVPARAETASEIRDLCAARWPADYRMQEYCQDKQLKAALWLIDSLEGLAKDDPIRQIAIRCFAKWQDDTQRYDYRMVRYCMEKQTESYRRLQE